MRTLLALSLSAFLASCDFLTDAATRAAFEIEAAAEHMRAERLDRYEFIHVPKAEPEGVVGRWELLIVVRDLGGRLHSTLCIGRYHTSYHNNFVRVPRTLRIAKPAGEGCVIVLRRNGDTIEVVELR